MRKAMIGIIMAATVLTPVAVEAQNASRAERIQQRYQRQGERNQARWLDVSFPELGHSMIAFLRPHDAPLAPSYQNSPEVADYFRRCEEERQRRRGEHWRLFGGPGTMFPNASPLARQPRTLAVWHPRGPHQTAHYVDDLHEFRERPDLSAAAKAAILAGTAERLSSLRTAAPA